MKTAGGRISVGRNKNISPTSSGIRSPKIVEKIMPATSTSLNLKSLKMTPSSHNTVTLSQ